MYAYSDVLSRIGWTPYRPGSIFGRDGFDENRKWATSYNTTQWTNLVTTITHDLTRTGAYQIDNIVPNIAMTMDQMIDYTEDSLLL